MKTLESVNPYDGNVIARFNQHSDDELSLLLRKAHERFLSWRSTDVNYRKQLMKRAAQVLRENSSTYAGNITKEIGKPITQSIAEVEKCAWVCDYYADHAESQLALKSIETDANESYVNYEPLGPVLAVMPWNYPFWQVFRFAAPSLMAGNVGILKHASNVSGSALNIESLFREAGFPEGCFTTLLISSDRVASVISNQLISAVTLTGSGPAGSAVASEAGAHIKKTVLELGGNNALIALKDCDIGRTVKTCVQARFQNTGQSCIAGKRLLVDGTIADEFMERLLEEIRQLQSGDPMDPGTYIGTLAREDLAKDLESQLERSLEMGARLVAGGSRRKAYFEPTVVTGVSREMPVFKEETFGPLLTVTEFNTLEEAIELSNDSRFGLGVSIFTKNIDDLRPHLFKFDEGAVFINELVKSDPRLPFGGIKESGYGRELSQDGILEFVNKKTVYIKN